MILSPPFLPARGAGQSHDAWLQTTMPPTASRLADTRAAEGSFPLSHGLAWHNGVHIQAPADAAGAGMPVRAIADGHVIFVHAPTAANARIDDAQNYNPFDRAGTRTAAWTDNGCVVVQHTTTIGVAGTAETEVVFCSLYMHLSALGRSAAGRPWQAGDAIWRKDTIGQPGRIYGHEGQIHFEISLDDANLRRLIGRAPDGPAPVVAPAVPPAPIADGRVDAVFGSLYFYLPASTPTATGARPASSLRQAARTTLEQAVWVKMSYEHGGCVMETFDVHGVSVRALPAQADAEYELYHEASIRHAALPPADRASSSISGWYELLRFGRNLGRGPAATDRDGLPAQAAHWRQIAGLAGTPVWADLNAAGSFKFSDADFLPVMGWHCFGDDTQPTDQRCDSPRLKEWIRDPDAANANRMEPAQLAARLGVPEVQRKLRRAICRFPSEWERGTSGQRYGFAQDLLEQVAPGSDAWPRLQAHLQALTFDGLPAACLAADWRPHPIEFFSALAGCGWLSQNELPQLLPRQHGPDAAHLAAISWATARARFEPYRVALNRTLRKYLIENALRQTHFLAQTYIETAMWQTMEEFGRAHQQRRNGVPYWPAAAMEYYGAFYGRGIMQLTWAGNYESYGDYRPLAAADAGHAYVDERISRVSLHYWADPRDRNGRIVAQPQRWSPRFDPSTVSSVVFIACDSGAHYWVSKNVGQGHLNINRACDAGMTTAAVGRASVLVNGGGYGYAERQGYAAFIHRFRADSTESAATSTFNVTHGTRTHSVHVDFTPQRPR
ncbi:MAG: hypothetical protein ABI143_06675 [Caldimonas sp.]